MAATIKKWKWPLILLGLIIITYIVGIVFYSTHFLPRTYLNNVVLVGNNDETTAYANMDTYYQESIFDITGQDEAEDHFNLKDIGIATQYRDNMATMIQNQSPYLWPMALFKDNSIKFVTAISYDEEKFNQIVEGLDIVSGKKVVAPENAKFEVLPTGAQVTEAVEGSTLDVEAVKEKLAEKIKSSDFELDVLKNNLYVRPTIHAADLDYSKQIEAYNAYLGIVVNMDMVDAKEVIDFGVFSKWMKIDDSCRVYFDENLIDQYINELAEKYDTYQIPQKFKATDIGEIEVGGTDGDTYGFLLAHDATKDKILTNIRQGGVNDIEPEWWYKGWARGYNCIGNTYVEIDITRQHWWYYVDGKLTLDTDIVTGMDTPKRETPVGLFRIWNKASPARLVSVEDKYDTYVEYWLEITWGGIGIHDASWRWNYGGDIYKYDGSHGCINTPFDIVKSLYEQSELNTPVVIYRS